MKNGQRILIYSFGMFLLALGIVLNTKANLGVSPIISIPFSIATIWNWNLGWITAIIYLFYVLGEILILRKAFSPIQLLQIPLSILFGIAINFFSGFLKINSTTLQTNLVILFFGILLTGIGAAFTLQMNLIPNAADGFVQAVSKKTGKKVGLMKNLLDLTSVALTLLIGLSFAGKAVGIGLGTVLAVIGVGRVIALTNKVFGNRMRSVYSPAVTAQESK